MCRPEPQDPLPEEPTAIRTHISHGESLVEGRLVLVEPAFFRPEIDHAWMGRLPLAEEYGGEGFEVVVLGQGLRQALGGNPDMIGSRIGVAGSEPIVIGVMPPEYREAEGPTAWIPR